MVREVYKQYERPLVRALHGLSKSWEPFVATAYNKTNFGAAWSPCNRFIAVAQREAVELRDAATLALINSFECPDSQELSLTFSPDSRFLSRFTTRYFVSWDLETGESDGPITGLTERMHASRWYSLPIYSTDGKMLAVVSPKGRKKTSILTYGLSTTQIHTHCIAERRVILQIWTRDEFLRYATLKSGHITIWEIDFTLTHRPKAVNSLSIPDEMADVEAFKESLFLPACYRLALSLRDKLFVWDARDSKFLLKTSHPCPSEMSFSSDGLFFAFHLPKTAEGSVWKESHSGYALHQQFMFGSPNIMCLGPLLSPDGTSVIICPNEAIRLWHTRDPILPQGSPTPTRSLYKGFILEFSPSGTLAVFANKSRNSVTIFNLWFRYLPMVANMDRRFMAWE